MDDPTASAPAPERPGGSGFSPRAVAAVVALAFGLILLVEVFVAPPSTFGGVDNPGAWFPPRSRAELLVAKMDGHTFAQTASDPLMRRTVADYHGDETNAAYRSSRPLMGWLYFVASAGGQRPLLAPAILVCTALTAASVVLAATALCRAIGARPQLLGFIPAMPALVAAAAYPGIGEPFGCALALAGLAAWMRRRTWWAVGLFTAATLTREMLLLVPLGIALDHVFHKRTLRPVLPFLVAPAAYAAWVGVVYARIGALPSSYSPMDGLLVGFRQGFPHWRVAEWLTAALLVASAAVIIRWGRSWAKVILALHAGFYLFMNYQVWWVWLGFGRVGTIIPLLALVTIAEVRTRRDTDASAGTGVEPSDEARMAMASG